MSLLFLYGLLFIEWDIYSFVTADLRLNARNMDNSGSLFQAEGLWPCLEGNNGADGSMCGGKLFCHPVLSVFCRNPLVID